MLLILLSKAQSREQFTKDVFAYSSYKLQMLEVPFGSTISDNNRYKSIPFSEDVGFIYINVPDSLIVFYCGSKQGDFKISERLSIKEILEGKSLHVNTTNVSGEKVVVRVSQTPELFLQFYFPESPIYDRDNKQMLAFEFSNLVAL